MYLEMWMIVVMMTVWSYALYKMFVAGHKNGVLAGTQATIAYLESLKFISVDKNGIVTPVYRELTDDL